MIRGCKDRVEKVLINLPPLEQHLFSRRHFHYFVEFIDQIDRRMPLGLEQPHISMPSSPGVLVWPGLQLSSLFFLFNYS